MDSYETPDFQNFDLVFLYSKNHERYMSIVISHPVYGICAIATQVNKTKSNGLTWDRANFKSQIYFLDVLLARGRSNLYHAQVFFFIYVY